MSKGTPKTQTAIDDLCINTIRTLSMDAVQKANSGHPGAPMGLAPAGYALWTRVLKHNGPTGGSLDDVSVENTLIAGTDEVAIDSYSLRFLDVAPEAVPFLALAEQRGLGVTMRLSYRLYHQRAGFPSRWALSAHHCAGRCFCVAWS